VRPYVLVGSSSSSSVDITQIKGGFHEKKNMSTTVEYLKSLESIRARASLLLDYQDHLKCFDVNLSKLPAVADDIVKLIKRDYSSPSEIPPHSRWHFEAGPGFKIDRIGVLVEKWKTDNVTIKESVRRLLDLFVVGVLLDAGAGSLWKYTPQGEQHIYNRSEGLGIASFDLFASGILSKNPKNPHQCDSEGLLNFTPNHLQTAFQVSDSNPLVGLEGRCLLLQRLGKVLDAKPEYFKGPDGNRPGYLLDYLLKHGKPRGDKTLVDINILWDVVVNGLSGIWPPTRTSLDGVSLGDVWPCEAMKSISKETPSLFEKYPGSEGLICFHKLSQWLTYSLMEPLALADIEFEGIDNMTGLAEYRNG
jgi:Protein of unknown function (DUF1688)